MAVTKGNENKLLNDIKNMITTKSTLKNKDKQMMKLRIVIVPILFFFSMIQAQEVPIHNTKIETQADRDWKILEISMHNLPASFEKYMESPDRLLKMRYLEDSVHTKRFQLAKAFWSNYPEDDRRDKAMYIFFSGNTRPHFFISKNIPDSLEQILRGIPSKEFRKFFRLVPFNHKKMEQWLKTGDTMVATVLNSDASLERKETAALQLIAREFYLALSHYMMLDQHKESSDYWDSFGIRYWHHLRFLLENHVNQYASLETENNRVKIILDMIKTYSKAASDAYWQYFYEITGANHPKADQPSIKALHELAAKNVAAIENLKSVDYSKPLDMAFTAMDGSEVDVSKMRGKVVLIDFWATYCGPCIKEMPHVRALYDKYKDQGFEVIGIAADNDAARERIETILKKTGANWPQRLDKAAVASVNFHALYGITSLPTVWLLNKEGVIVDRNARGEKLEPLIRKNLGL